MARPCIACTELDPETRIAFDAELLSGRPVSTILQDPRFVDSPVTEQSARRHRANHLMPRLVQDLAEDFTVLDATEQLASALADVAAVRIRGLASGNSALVLKAAGVTGALVRTLHEVAPDADLSQVATAREGIALGHAVGWAIHTDPHFGAALVTALDEIGGDPEVRSWALEFTAASALAQSRKKEVPAP